MWLAHIYVTLKPVVNDPQGLAIRGALHNLGFQQVSAVRAGKYLEITLDGENREAAAQSVSDMCRKLLANQVIEDSRFDLEEVIDRGR